MYICMLVPRQVASMIQHCTIFPEPCRASHADRNGVHGNLAYLKSSYGKSQEVVIVPKPICNNICCVKLAQYGCTDQLYVIINSA